jgi:carboxyl-terminal processing protease
MENEMKKRAAAGIRRAAIGYLAAFILLLFPLYVFVPQARGFDARTDYSDGRARLLGYLLKQELTAYHFSHKKIDTLLSRSAFDLYLKQLDFQKRFLLSEDVKKLRGHADGIGDEINGGRLELPVIAARILARRVGQVRKMTKDLLAADFDFSQDEYMETDNEKLEYCANSEALKERWRLILKQGVLARYLGLLDDRASNPGAEKEQQKGPEELRKSAREKVLKNYEEFFTRMLNEKKSEQYDRFFGAFTRAFDPHTDYLPPVSKEDFEISMKGALEGIGAVLREEDGYIRVESVMPGSPAARQGQLLAGDVILKVAEGNAEPVDIVDMKIRDAVRLIRGKKGTEVKLTVRRQGGIQLLVPIVRDVVLIEETFAKGIAIRDAKSGRLFGYIKLPSFYRDFEGHANGKTGRTSTEDVRRELKRLEAEGVEGIVFDLRNNGGGALTDAVNIAGLFISKGPVVQVKSSQGRMSVLSGESTALEYRGPLVVLVNKFSASASEILAGVLQDYGRAVILGAEHTHGKGTVQAMIDLDQNLPFPGMDRFKPLGALKITTQKFYRVSGESTQYRGVMADIVLPDRLSSLKTGEQYIENALPWDTVKPVPYQKWQLSKIDSGALSAKSRERVKSDPDFLAIEKESDKVGELQNKTRRSLNIDAVRAEREEAKKLSESTMFHGHRGDVKKKPGDLQLAAGEKEKAWGRELEDDPYVRESMAVLGDMLLLQPGLSMN